MKVISIGTDRKIFEKGSAVRKRQKAYGKLVDELHLIVFATKSLGFTDGKISENVFVYPTNSKSRWHYMRDAKKIGAEILEKQKNRENSVIDTQDPFETGLVGTFLSKRFSIPLLIQVHTDFLSPYFKNTLLNRIRIHLSQKTLKTANHIRVVSGRIKSSLLKRYPDRSIEVLPIFVDPRQYARDEPVARNTYELLMVSRLEKEKKIEAMIGIVGRLVTKFSDIKLTIVGDGSERKALERFADTKGLSGHVKHISFAGWSNNLPQYYARAGCFINTSLYEGYGRTIVEAALCGTPIITTDVGLVGDDLHDETDLLVCSVGDSDCLESHITRVLENPEEAKQRAQVAREKVLQKLGTFDEYLKKYRTVWEHCLK